MILLKLTYYLSILLRWITTFAFILMSAITPFRTLRYFAVSNLDSTFLYPIIALAILAMLRWFFCKYENQVKEIFVMKSKATLLKKKDDDLIKKEAHLRKTEIFLSHQIDKYNSDKDRLMTEVREYHDHLVQDFILKNSKTGTTH
jgi:ABC-type transport system involved in cytochrome bd biosynthesis fused ATPase/permease subunit